MRLSKYFENDTHLIGGDIVECDEIVFGTKFQCVVVIHPTRIAEWCVLPIDDTQINVQWLNTPMTCKQVTIDYADIRACKLTSRHMPEKALDSGTIIKKTATGELFVISKDEIFDTWMLCNLKTGQLVDTIRDSGCAACTRDMAERLIGNLKDYELMEVNHVN